MTHTIVAVAVTWLAITAPVSTEPQGAVEQQIRQLEQREAAAVLRGDSAEIERLWSPDFTVNNPLNQVVKGMEGPIRSGALTYSSFTREIEAMLIRGDTVVVMGRETVVPSGTSRQAGQMLRRRYTNVWMRSGGTWMLTARHANVICQD